MSTGASPNPYPPQPYGPPPVPRAPRVPMRGTALAGAALAVVSAALLVVGSFFTLWGSAEFEDNRKVLGVDVTSWARTVTPTPTGAVGGFYEQTHSAIYGIPLSVVAVALLVAAALTFLSARQDSAPRRVTVARFVTLGAVAAAVLSVSTLSMDVESTVGIEGAAPNETSADHTTYDTGLGYWLLVGGAVVAIVAAVLVFLKQRGDSDRTPPQGFPAPAGYGPPQQGPGWRPAQPGPQQPGPQQPGPQQQSPQQGQQQGPQQAGPQPQSPQQPGSQQASRPGAQPPGAPQPGMQPFSQSGPEGPAPSPVVPQPSGPAREHPLEADAPTQWRPMKPPEQPAGASDPQWEPPSSEQLTSRLEPEKPEPDQPEPGDRD